MQSILPRAVRELSNELTRLPGIGPKSARRLAIHLLRQPRQVVGRLGDAMKNLHANVQVCSWCYNLADDELCVVCKDEMREKSRICIVESPLDVEAIERSGSYNGLYHVLGGVLSPVEGITEDQLTMSELVQRMQKGIVTEVIVALNPTLEGEATARHISQLLGQREIEITRLGRGLPTGGDIEFADAITLSAAFEGRKEMS